MAKKKAKPQKESAEQPVSRFEAFPLLIFVITAYAIYMLGAGTPDIADERLATVLAQIPMFSGRSCNITTSDVFIAATFGLLFQETIRAAFNNNRTWSNHLFSLLVLIASIILFFGFETYGTSTFMFITLATLFDVIAGFYITLAIIRKATKESPIVVSVSRKTK